MSGVMRCVCWSRGRYKNAGGNPPALGGQPLREDRFPYTTNGRMDARGVSSDSVLHPCFVNRCNAISGQSLCGSEGGDRSACALAGFGLCVASCASSDRFATMTASGCPCLELRAAPFVCRLIASQLALAISFRFGARTPCCGHGLDHRLRQSHRRSGKFEQLNNQVHGRITSFPRRRRCQHTGLTPLTLHYCIIYTRTNVSKYKVNSSLKSERRAA